MKRLGLMLLTLALLACGTASAYNPYAPNPFDAIEQDSWEYKYLLDLTKAGLTGTDMTRFSPSYVLTRVEMRDMLVTALKNRSRATVSQQKEMDRLASEYAEDLTYARDGETLKTETETPAGDPFDWKQGDKTK
ncbi:MULTISPECIES: hypothetical protein [unclassified Megasphaera]|uniref:hypothetical protein n=1 Tax=unclassified Megasphaera TaxID=2626256 RepID=UPI000EDE3015|nr:hypothetical protein [Megasphaera sp. UBA4233]HAM04044.1 hypothetical protein [Megasphaera sp.]